MNNKKIFLLVIGFLILFSLPIWLVEFLPLTDYPNHLLRIHILKEYENPLFNFQDYFLVEWKLLPNLASDVIILFLSYLFPISISGKIYLNIFVLLFPLSIFYFLKTVDQSKVWLGFFGFLLVYNWYFNMGYMNFYGSIPVFFFTLGYWLSSPQLKSLKEKTIQSFLLTALYFFHFFSWLVVVFSLVILSLKDMRNRPKIKNTIGALIPSVLLSVYYFLGLRAGSSVERGATFVSPIDTVIGFVVHTFVNFSRLDILIYLAPMLIFGYLLLKTNLLQRVTQNPMERRLFWLFCCLFGLMFILPRQISAVWPFNIRLNLFLIFIGIASISSKSAKSLKNLLLPTIICFSLLNSAYVFFRYYELNQKIRVYTSGIEHMEFNKNVFPLTQDMQSGWETLSPLAFCWAYYHMVKGGAGPYLFDLPHGQIVNYKKPAREIFPAPPLYKFEIEKFDLIKHSAPYDYILEWGSFPKAEEKIKKKFELIYHHGEVKLYKKINQLELDDKTINRNPIHFSGNT